MRKNNNVHYWFKCRCMEYCNQRMTGIYYMEGHMSLIQVTNPTGLHRIWYECVSLNDWEWERKTIHYNNFIN